MWTLPHSKTSSFHISLDLLNRELPSLVQLMGFINLNYTTTAMKQRYKIHLLNRKMKVPRELVAGMGSTMSLGHLAVMCMVSFY